MPFADKLKDLRNKAEEAVVERKDQIEQAVQKAGTVADERTGGKYSEKIEQAGGKAVGLVDSLEASRRGTADGSAAAEPGAAEGSGGAEDQPPPSEQHS